MTISVRFDEEVEKRLLRLAKDSGRSMSFYIRAAVMEKLEDLADFNVAEKALRENSRTYTMDEVDKLFGLAD